MRACLARDGNAQLSSREERGLAIAVALQLRPSGKRRVWMVQSQRHDTEYRVCDGACSCPDERSCKHVFAVHCLSLHAECLSVRLCREDSWDGTIEDVLKMQQEYDQLLRSAVNYSPPADSLLFGFRLEAIGDDLLDSRALRGGAMVGYVPESIRMAGLGVALSRYSRSAPSNRHISAVRPWVARIGGLCPQYEFVRQFADGHKDYREANGTGSRGVWVYYELPPGLYEVQEPQQRRHRRYFARVENLQMVEIEKSEVLACLAGKLC